MTTTDLQAADLLDEAAALLERDGWRQFSAGPPIGYSAPRCASGALWAVMRGHGFGVACEDLAREALCYSLQRKGIVAWNDAPGRTAAEVIATMRTCAQKLRADATMREVQGRG